MKVKLLFFLLLLTMTGVFINGCNTPLKQAQENEPLKYSDEKAVSKYNYIFAVHPLYNPDELMAVFQPMVDYLNTNIPELKMKLEASKDYASFEEKLSSGKVDFALPNPYQTYLALKKGYHVFGKMGDDANFRGTFIVRKDSMIKNISDLKGKTISYPSSTALAATMMPQYFLYENNIDVNRDITNMYVGSQESSIMNAYLKNSDIAATWPIPWKSFQKKYPKESAELYVIWETESFINNGLVAKNTIDGKIVQKVADLICNLDSTEEGKKILERMEISQYEYATDKDYEKVGEFLKKFSESVRHIDY